MSYQKNDVLTVKIEDMGHDGEGIGKCEGYTLFVKDTVIGDLAEVKVIKAKKNYGYARLMRLIEPSAHRVEPVCPVARPCGGCQLQMLDYAEQLRFKEKKIAGNLQRIGGMTEIPMEPIVGMENPFRYRNKAQFPIGQDRNGKLITGFYAGRTHQIMENRNCYLGVEQNEEILNRILAWMEENGVPAYNEETGKGLVRHVLIRFGFMTKEIMVCLVVNGKKLPAEEIVAAPYYNGDAVTMIDENPDLAFYVPKEGTNLFVDAMCIPKNAKNVEGAEKFINFMCSTEAAMANWEYIGYSSPHTGLYEQLDEETKSDPLYFPDTTAYPTEAYTNLPKEISQYYNDLWVDILT